MNKSRIFLSILLPACSLLPIHADDFGLWTDAGISQDIGTTGLSADVDLGYRMYNNWKNVDRWNVGAGLSYDLTSFLKISAGYDFLYCYQKSTRTEKYNGTTWKGYNIENSYWRPKNRFHVDLKGKTDIGRFTISLRERYQLTGYNSMDSTIRKDKYRFNTQQNLDGTTSYILQGGYPESEMDSKSHKTKHYLRSCLEVEYNISHCPVNPYASFELSNNLSNGFSIDKRRYSIGADWKIAKGQHLSIGYVYTNGNDDDEDGNLHVIEISYNIKGLFTKK